MPLSLERRSQMKRFILTLAAIASVAGPILATASSAMADPRWDRHDERRDSRWERHDDRRDRRDGRWDRREDRWDGREDRWDAGRHNGYYYNNRWAYGPPPVTYYHDPGFRPGYQTWRRGGYLPPYYRGYVVNDYARYRLRPPPRGYYWYRVGDDYLLAAVTTGLITDLLINSR
jgi:Ni/Co efflux regulator RcnB